MPSKIAPKGDSRIIMYCDRVIKTSIYVLVFLIPLFFLPLTYGAVEFNKQALLVVLSFIALGAWMLKTMVSGKLTVTFHPVHWGVLALVVASGLATIFSMSPYASFWGTVQFSSQAFISVLALALVYFLISNTFEQKDIEVSFSLLGISGVLVMIYGMLQMFGFYIIPLNMAKNISFNTIGSLGSLGFFAACLLPLFVVFSVKATARWRLLWAVNILLALAILILVNYHFVWLVATAGSLLLIIFWVMHRNVLDVRWMFLPIFFFIVSLFFVLFTPQIAWLVQKPLEVSLSNKANLDMNLRGLKSFEVFGSGPANFAYDFAKYKNKDFNESPIWNVNFTSGASKVLTSFTEIGIVGLLALLALMVLPLFYGFRYFLSPEVKQNPQNVLLVSAIFVTLISITLGYFLYNASIPLDFIYFFALAALVVLLPKSQKQYDLKTFPMLSIVTVSFFVVMIIFIAGVLFLGGQRYFADAHYQKGLMLFNQNKKDESLAHLRKAAKVGNTDIYFNQLSLFSLARLQEHLAGPATGNDQQTQQALQPLILDAIRASNASVVLAPKSPVNWSTRGYVCQSLLGLSSEAPVCAIQSYDKAIELNPTSPYLYLQEGNIYVAQAQANQDQAEKADLLAKSVEKFSKAVELKSNYALAYLQLASVLKLQGNLAGSAEALGRAQTYSGSDAAILFSVGLAYYEDKNWVKAQDSFQRALNLVPGYANALYFSGLTYNKQGQQGEAVARFTKLLDLNVNKQNIQKIIDNINAGRPALDGVTQQPPAPVDSPAAPGSPEEIPTP